MTQIDQTARLVGINQRLDKLNSNITKLDETIKQSNSKIAKLTFALVLLAVIQLLVILSQSEYLRQCLLNLIF